MLWILTEVSKKVGLSIHTLRRLCNLGMIPAIKFRGRWVFNEAQIEYAKEWAKRTKKYGYSRRKKSQRGSIN